MGGPVAGSGSVNSDEDTATAVLRRASGGLMGLLHPEPLAPDGDVVRRQPGAPEWEPMAEALEPARLAVLVDGQVRRWSGARRTVAASLLVREITGLVISVAVDLWGTSRRVLDLSIPNLELACTDDATRLALRRPGLQVLPGDPAAGEPEVMVAASSALRDALLATVLDGTIPTVIDSMQEVTRTGTRHLWGNVALGIANGFTTIGHSHDAADEERERFLAHRPELGRTIELVTVDDGVGGGLTCALRRNCCLLDEVDPAFRCVNCSLNDDPERRRQVVAHYVAERRAARAQLT